MSISNGLIFISYARSNTDFARKLVSFLEERGYSVYFDTQSIELGANFASEIDAALRASYKVIGIWSKKSIKSDWVRKECGRALELKKLIPVMIEEISSTDIPIEFDKINYLNGVGLTYDQTFENIIYSLQNEKGIPKSNGVKRKKISRYIIFSAILFVFLALISVIVFKFLSDVRLDGAQRSLKGHLAYENGNYEEARRFLEQACRDGVAEACNTWGWMNEKGLGVVENAKSAKRYYELACAGRNPEGCGNLGNVFNVGLDSAPDYKKARLNWRKSCEFGSSKGCSSYGIALIGGIGGDVDKSTGLEFLRKGCARGDLWGCSQLEELGFGPD